MYFDLISNSEKRDCRPIFDAGQYGTNLILISFVFFEKQDAKFIQELPV